MKNIFKLMGIAVLACSMMVACGKDNDDPTDTTPDNPTPTPVPENVYTLVWNGEAQTPGYVGAMTNGQLFAFQAADHREGNSIYLPIFTVYMQGTSASDMAIVPGYTEVGIETVYTDNENNQYLDWQYDEGANQVFNVTAFDATTYKMSANMDLTFYSLTDYQNDVTPERQQVMNLTITNYTFEMASK